MPEKSLYVIGSLRNKAIPEVARKIREHTGLEAFDDWWSASEDADEWWQAHEAFKGRSYIEAINGYHAEHVFDFDKKHLDRSVGAVLVLPAGKSAHLEFGYIIGQGKRGYVLFDREPERFDIMYRFANGGIFFDVDSLCDKICRDWIHNER